MTRILIVAAIALGALVGWVLLGPSTSTPPRRVDLPPSPDEEGPQTHVVLMRVEGGRFVFDPVGLFVRAGERVLWLNLGDNHSTTAYHPQNGKELRIPEGAEPWDSGILGLADKPLKFEHIFRVEGTYDYYCLPHEFLGMVGRIVVGRPGGPAEEKPLSLGLPEAAQEEMPSTAAVMTGVGNWASEINRAIFLVFEEDPEGAARHLEGLLRAYEEGRGSPTSLYRALERFGLERRFGELLAQYRDLLTSNGSFREIELKADELKELLTQLQEHLLGRQLSSVVRGRDP